MKSKTSTARKLTISKGASRYDPPNVGAVTWDQLARKLCTFHVTSETFEAAIAGS